MGLQPWPKRRSKSEGSRLGGQREDRQAKCEQGDKAGECSSRELCATPGPSTASLELAMLLFQVLIFIQPCSQESPQVLAVREKQSRTLAWRLPPQER